MKRTGTAIETFATEAHARKWRELRWDDFYAHRIILAYVATPETELDDIRIEDMVTKLTIMWDDILCPTPTA